MIYYIIIGVILILVISIVCFIVVRKRHNVSNKNENKNEISMDRVNAIKEKYKAIEKIKKMKRITKEDVEKFYKSQIE